jgi:hypothetical protein
MLDRGLSDQQAVERIALALSAKLDIGEAAIRGGVSNRNGKQGKSFGQEFIRPLLGNLQLAERGFDRNLKKGSGADERLLRTGDRLPRGI